MNIKPIKSEKDYTEAMKRLEVIFDVKKGSAEGDELEILGILVDQYENEHFQSPYPIQSRQSNSEWNN